MRWARFDDGGTPAYGVVEGDTLIPVRGSPFNAWERTPAKRKLSDVKLLIPVVPPTFYAAGLNYAQHVKEAAEKLGLPVNLPTQPDIGYRANNAVIGRQCKNLTRENALTAVMGWTIGNDVSERSWQKQDRTLWRSKNTDTFKPMGPWIETDVKLDDLHTKIRLNGKELIDFETNNMVFGVVDYLVAMTTCLTLYPGDVIWMGTEGKTENMKHGDTIEVEITGIGTLSNGVVREGQ